MTGLRERKPRFSEAKGLYAVNIVSSPGSGKDDAYRKDLEMAAGSLPAAVIVGDLETANDAARLRARERPCSGNHRTVCHLDAEMVGHGLEPNMDLNECRVLIIGECGAISLPRIV